MSDRRSADELIQELRRVAEITDGSPRKKDMDELGKWSSYVYHSRFGSWNQAVEKAGLMPNKRRSEIQYTKDELIEELKRINKTTSGSPTQRDMNELGEYSIRPYIDRFGSWSEALEQAGLSLNKNQYTRNELLRELRRLHEELDRSPTQSDMDEHGTYYPIYYQREFGSWNEAKAAAGIEKIEPGGEYNKVSRDELIDELIRLNEETDRPVTQEEMNKRGMYSHQVYKRKFGSWDKTLEEAGVEKSRKVDEETLLRELRRLYEDLDRSPTQYDADQYAKFSARTYANKFGSFNEAKRKAGLETRIPGYVGSGPNNPRWKGGRRPYYGPSWGRQRRKALERDGHGCVECGMTESEHREKYGSDLEVHHKRPVRVFDRDRHEEFNALSNLVTLCRYHHRKWERLPVQPHLPD